MLMQFWDFQKAWKTSKLDALIWMTTFLTVVVVDIDIGLAAGVGVSLITLIWRSHRAYTCIMGEIPNTGVYVDVKRFPMVSKIHSGFQLLLC
jgi:MFS superfamily sulfate permease-like transporter